MNFNNLYCLCLHNELYEVVKKLNYVPVGLGENYFNKEWVRDNTGDNISNKNKFYGTHSFHYWFWKNELYKIKDNEWIGFCAYRRLWVKKDYNENKTIYENILREIPSEWNNYETILGDHVSLTKLKLMKVLKYGKLALLRNPRAVFKKGRNIRFHFDMFHGNGLIDKAIDVLNYDERNDFKNYIQTNTSFNQGVMFFCRSKNLLNQYYKTIFSWLTECEKQFGFDLHGYGQTRIYDFLAERFMPFWFNKYSKPLEWPIKFYDLRKEL